MFSSRYFQNIRNGPVSILSSLALIAATVAISLSAAPAHAVINDTDWSLKISERENAFHPATDVMAMKTLMWDLPASRRAARNVPFICLTNDSNTASITQFKMTIGDDQFHFANQLMGMYAKLGKDTPGFSLSSSVEDGGDTLLVNFLNGGIAPGKTVNFQIDIDVDAEFAGVFFQHPDYRTVLFDMNGDNYYESASIVNDPSSDDNSKVSLTFSMAGMPSVTTGPTPFPDPNVLDGSARFVNANIARYGDSDPIRAFLLSGGTANVPEPGTMVLGLFGMMGFSSPLARRRRKAASLCRAA
jgi:PEP-CTERM motif